MDNQADKSQEATPYKLEEARKKGQVARSVEFVSMCSVGVMCFGLCLFAPKLGRIMVFHTSVWMRNVNQIMQSPALMIELGSNFLKAISEVILLIMLLGMLAAILASIIHMGPVFSLFPLKFDIARLNPVNGLKKIISVRGFFDFIKLILKITFFSIAIYLAWAQVKSALLFPSFISSAYIVEIWRHATYILLSFMMAVYVIFGLFDLWYAKREFAKKMRMSTRDIKDEYRRREGDPELKNKRKRKIIELLKSAGGISKIKSADVVVTNPTHVAVALQYRTKTMALPVVIAKGRGLFAKLIIWRAKKYGIPIYRRPPLARKIYEKSLINSVIPLSEQNKIAEIYREVLKKSNHKVFL
jgi:flagellar biosynthesis protein FlhB